MPRRALAVLLALALASPAVAAPGRWTLDDLLDLRGISDPQVHVDAVSVAYVVTDWNAEHSDYQTDLWVSRLNGAESRRLTFTDQNEDTPRWSPDGHWLAFLADRARPGKHDESGDPARRQVWMMRTDGGEAQCVTDAAGGVSTFEWSQDAKTIAYLSSEPKSAEQQKREQDKDDAWRPEQRYPWSRLWVIDVASRKATQLTTTMHVTGFSLSPDGQRVVFAAQPTPRVPDVFASDLYTVPVAGGKPTPLVVRPGIDESPTWSPDGKWIAFVSQDGRGTEWTTDTYVCVVPATGGTTVDLTKDFDEFIEGPLRWSFDGTWVAFVADQGLSRQLFRAYVDGSPVGALTSGRYVHGTPSLDPHGLVAVYTRESSEEPRDIYFQRIGGADPKREPGGLPVKVTDANPTTRDYLSFSKEKVTWKGPDGLDIEGLLIYPVDYRAGAKVPLLVVAHGGPAIAHQYSCTVQQRVFPYAVLAQHGWAILLPNPRGSGGYGEKFRAANVRDWGGKDYEDIMAGVDAMVQRGIADANRLAVCGWSYGGYMTATIVTKTDRFKAAVVGAGVIDLPAMAGTSDIPEFDRSYFQAWPWDDPQVYVDHSPLFHVKQVKTPTSLIHGAGDDRVPTSQAWEFYNALKRVGVTTDLLLLPRMPHVPYEPRLMRAAMQWHLDWLEQYTLGRAPETRPAAATGERR